MAEFYSDQYAAAGTETASPTSGYRVPAGAGGNGIELVIARASTDGCALNDVFRMIPNLHSSTRIYRLELECPSTPSAGTIHIGVHNTGFNYDGAVVDNNLFESSQSVTSGLDMADVFTGAGLGNIDRGKPLWELGGLTEDPNVFYDLTITAATGITTASAIEMTLFAEIMRQGV